MFALRALGFAVLVPVCLAAFAGSAEAARITQPCATAAATRTTMLPLLGTTGLYGATTYCQTAFGWTDTWFANGQPSLFSLSQDVLSGDNAAWMSWDGITGLATPPASGILSPYLDGGSLSSHRISSDWSVAPGGGLAYVGTGQDSTTSTIWHTDADGVHDVEVTILTAFANGGLTEQFTITDIGTTSITGLEIGDYFNFHPAGATGGNQNCGIAAVAAGTLTISPSSDCQQPIVAEGQVSAAALPVSWEVGPVPQVLADLAAGSLSDTFGPVGPGDEAGALIWSLGNLAPGGSTDFTIVLDPGDGSGDGGTGEDVPEPAVLPVFATGLLALVLRRRHG